MRLWMKRFVLANQNIFVWSIKWYQFIVSHTPSFIWFSNVGKCSAGTGHSRDLPVFSFFCIFWWNIHNMGPIWPLHQYPRRQNQKYDVHFQVIGLELRALCLCISGNILLQDFYQNHFKLSVFLSNNLECSSYHHRLCQPLQTSFESADEELN